MARLNEKVRNATALARAGLADSNIAALFRLAPQCNRVAVAECNGQWADGVPFDYEGEREQRHERAVRRVASTLPSGWSVKGSGDPRGYTLRVVFDGLRGNTMGGTNEGDDFGIYGS